jgi:multidrug transporter EmrE-like cation transporter
MPCPKRVTATRRRRRPDNGLGTVCAVRRQPLNEPQRKIQTSVSRYIPLILFTVLTNAAAQIMLKKGMMAVGGLTLEAGLISTVFRVIFNPWVFAGLTTFVISMASHLVVLSKVELSFAYPFLSLAYIVVAVYAYFVFKEDVNSLRIAGFGLICLGTLLISRS